MKWSSNLFAIFLFLSPPFMANKFRFYLLKKKTTFSSTKKGNQILWTHLSIRLQRFRGNARQSNDNEQIRFWCIFCIMHSCHYPIRNGKNGTDASKGLCYICEMHVEVSITMQIETENLVRRRQSSSLEQQQQRERAREIGTRITSNVCLFLATALCKFTQLLFD